MIEQHGVHNQVRERTEPDEHEHYKSVQLSKLLGGSTHADHECDSGDNHDLPAALDDEKRYEQGREHERKGERRGEHDGAR